MLSLSRRLELGLKIDKKSTFCEADQSILGTKRVISSQEPMRTFEIRNLDYLINSEKVEEATKRDHRDVSNRKMKDDKHWPTSQFRILCPLQGSRSIKGRYGSCSWF